MEDIEWWRKFFVGSGADIWTVIREALNLAAFDHPKTFKERRADIGEILFSRNLLDLHHRHLHQHHSHHRQPHPKAQKSSELEQVVVHRSHIQGSADADAVVDGDADDRAQDLGPDRNASIHGFQDEAEVLSDQLEEERITLMEISNIKETITDRDQLESSLFEALRRLQLMDVNIHLLQETMIGKHVKHLQKHSSQRVSELAKYLISHWKYLVDEYQDNIRRASNTATSVECGELPTEEPGLPEPPFDAGALWASSATEFSQLVNFMHDDTCEQMKDKCKIRSFEAEPSVKEHSLSSSRSRTDSLLTDLSDFDTKASTNRSEDLTTTVIQGSRDKKKAAKPVAQMKNNDDQQKHKDFFPKSRSSTTGSGPGRPADMILKTNSISNPAGKLCGELTSLNKSNTRVLKAPTSCSDIGVKLPNSEIEKSQTEKKLEIAKRKLHQGYEQAEKAKRQRTVQVLDIPDLPKDKQAALVRGNKANRTGSVKAGIWNRSVKPTRR